MMLPEKYKHSIAVNLDTLWKIWRGLGLFSDGSMLSASIEEALFGLCIFGRYDQRLYDEAVSLLIRYPDLIYKSKIEFFLRNADETTRSVFAVLCTGFPGTPSGKRLQTIIPEKKQLQQNSGVPFFQSLQYPASFLAGKPDPTYYDYGWLRNRFSSSSNVPSLSTIASLNPWVRAKLIFGNTGRVDVILSLLIGEETAPAIARKTGCTPKGAWNILTDLEYAGIASSRQALNKRVFKLSDEGRKRFSFLDPVKKAVSFWEQWRELGYYLHYIQQLPADASAALVSSEELRVAGILKKK
jgi:hypothetical protein